MYTFTASRKPYKTIEKNKVGALIVTQQPTLRYLLYIKMLKYASIFFNNVENSQSKYQNGKKSVIKSEKEGTDD